MGAIILARAGACATSIRRHSQVATYGRDRLEARKSACAGAIGRHRQMAAYVARTRLRAPRRHMIWTGLRIFRRAKR
jgi:hypothetical protein